MSKKQSHYIQLDLIILLLFFMTISILAIYNAQQLGQYGSTNYALQQFIYYALGIMFAIALQFVDLEQLYKSSIYLYIVGVLGVVILYFSPTSIARPVNNAKSWFNADVLPLTIQPSEFTKIAFIIFLAAIVVKHKEKYEKPLVRHDLWLILKVIIITSIPVAFIINQPDLGTSLVFFFIAGVIILLSEIDWKILATIIVGGIIAAVFAILLVVNFPELSTKYLGIKPYQIDRVMTWFDPTQQVADDRFQIDRSLLTIGSGKLTGKGMAHSEVALPEAHTDFIFSVVGESFGFVGTSIVVFAFFLLLYRLVTLGMKSYEFSPFSTYICFGFMALILLHTFQNIGMTIGIMPITGIPLLFISYGGSTVLSSMVGFAIVYLIAVEHSKEGESLFG